MEPAQSSGAISEMTVEADGRVSACQVHLMPGDRVLPDIPCPPSAGGLQMAVMQHAGLTKPQRFRYLAYTDRVFGDDRAVSGDLPEGVTVLQRYRIDFAIDAMGKAMDCRWSVAVGPVDTAHMPTRCDRDSSFVIQPNMPRTGFDQMQTGYQLLSPRP